MGKGVPRAEPRTTRQTESRMDGQEEVKVLTLHLPDSREYLKVSTNDPRGRLIRNLGEPALSVWPTPDKGPRGAAFFLPFFPFPDQSQPGDSGVVSSFRWLGRSLVSALPAPPLPSLPSASPPFPSPLLISQESVRKLLE